MQKGQIEKKVRDRVQHTKAIEKDWKTENVGNTEIDRGRLTQPDHIAIEEKREQIWRKIYKYRYMYVQKDREKERSIERVITKQKETQRGIEVEET